MPHQFLVSRTQTHAVAQAEFYFDRVRSLGFRQSASLQKINMAYTLGGNPRASKYFSLTARRDKYFRKSKHSHNSSELLEKDWLL